MTTVKEDIQHRRNRLGARRANLSSEKHARLSGYLKTGFTGIPLRRSQDESIPLSFAQERLWAWDQLNPGSCTYNMPLAAQIAGDLNVIALGHGLNEIARRHESLRTNFVHLDGQAVQVIAAARFEDLPIVDLGGLSESEWESEARGLAAKEAQRPFNLAEDSLLRVCLIKHDNTYSVLRTMHHIVSDLWSGEIFIRELGVLYQTYCAGGLSPLKDLSLQFADYSIWQRQWLQGEVLEGELAYWKQQLADIQVLELPTDRPRSVTATSRAASHGLTLPAELAEGLRALSRQEGVTLFVILLSALKILLRSYSGQEDIAVGTVLAGRSRIETEPLIGFFLNTLVMRSKLSSHQTVREVIRHVREVFLDAQAHQDVPFEKLLEELKPERSLSHTPLFQVMFSMSSAPPAAEPGQTIAAPFADLRFSELAGERREGRFEEAKFDLTITMAEMADRIGVSFEYNTDLFDRTTVQRMVSHYATVLGLVVADPDQCLANIELLSQAERHRLLIEWNQPDSDHPRNRCLSGLFEMQLARTPDAVAVEDDQQQLTYGELNGRANQLANYLCRFQRIAEKFVGVFMERSVDLVIGILGILKAGAVYVPLDPSQPDNRLKFMIEDSGLIFLLSSQRLVNRLPAGGVPVVRLDVNWPAIAEESAFYSDSQSDGDNAAYVIYTSGSTGDPKGVVASNTATLNRLEWMWTEHPLSSSDICCQKTIISFVDSVFETLGPILKGVRLSIIPEDAVKDPARLIRALSDKQVTHIVLVPSLLRMLFESSQELATQIPALTFWVTSGEYFSPDLAESFLRRLPQCKLLNSYGASEIAADVTYFDLESWRGPGNPVPIGFPISNTSVYLLDSDRNPCPIGAHGEVYVGGLAPARGYLDNPGLTAERFVPDHLGNTTGGRLYKTGDVARCLPQGSIDYIGRLDFQVKIRGFRIELGDIEATLRKHPEIRQATVIAVNNRSGDRRLTAYIVLRQGGALANDGLISFLKQQLPDYMIPADVIMIDRLPLTPSGKIDRIALSKLTAGPSGRQRERVAPRNVVEMQLAQIWERVLGIASIGVEDNFFSVGGTSLSAVRLVSHIDKQFGQRLTLNVLMQEGNIANLAKLLKEKAELRPHSPLVVFRREGSRPPLFFVHGIGGEVLEYYQLARLLGQEQPFYALQAPLNNASAGQDRSIEEVATQYLEAIREVQAEGPYWLGGFSWGGVVAFEMAQQLTRQYQQVNLLAIVDSAPPSAVRLNTRHQDEAAFLVKALQALAPADEKGLFAEEEAAHLVESGELYQHALERLQRWGVIEPGLAQENGETYLRSYVKRYMAGITALSNYEAKPFPGKITLFRVGTELSQAHAWSCLSTEPLGIREISGPHWKIMQQPQVQVLAEQLNECLQHSNSVCAR